MVTRQITNVAAGAQDTDAVNVAQLKAVSNTVDASKTKYYSVQNIPFTTGRLEKYAAYTNEKNDGAKEMGALAAGYMTYANGIASTVTGSLSGVINQKNPGVRNFRGATALSYGTFNINNNTARSKDYSGVANSIVGQANMTIDSNAALIYGAGNVISNSYRTIDISKLGAIMDNLKDPKALGEALQKAVPTSGGQVMAFGGGNVVDNVYMTQVIGVGNTVKGNQKKNNDGTWSSDGTGKFNDKTSSQLNYVDGFYTTLINGKNDYLIGANNTVTGDSVEKNHSNIVIGDNHTLTNGSHNVIIGSEDAETAKETPAARHGLRMMAAEETETSKSPDNVVRVGYNAKAKYDDSVALGSLSVANRKAHTQGVDVSGNNKANDSYIWTATDAALSIGYVPEENKSTSSKLIKAARAAETTAPAYHTRQLVGLAAGTNPTDGVNVAQLEALAHSPVHIYSGGSIKRTVTGTTYTAGKLMTPELSISNLQFDFGDGLKAQEVGSEGDKRVLVTLDKDALKEDPDFKGPKGEAGAQGPKGDKGDTGATGPQRPAGKDGRDGKDGGVGTVVDDGTNIKVVNQETDSTKPAKYKVSLKADIKVNSVTAGDVTINKDKAGTINNLKNKTWNPTKITSGQAATEDQLQTATKNAINYDGDNSKTVTLREDTTIKNVANTTIEEGSKNAVNAGTVYNETRVAKDGTFVKQVNTAGENLSALDNQVTANTESIYHMNGRISDLDNRVNKVGAGAAALAALHPLDFDPDDKWDFAIGYGNYRNANSIAFGAFYRPNEDTMFSLGTNFGNGENMFNAGLSFKIGQGSGITTSRTAMAKKIASLEDTVDKQDKKIAELEALVKEQGEMIRQYVGKK